ncbi:MAG: hypothetical protein II866_07325 [Prevotella sp.]|nr:hypothetical protein [Prevotella sp.]
MTTDIIKVVATLAISIVFDSCHNVRETVEEGQVGKRDSQNIHRAASCSGKKAVNGCDKYR